MKLPKFFKSLLGPTLCSILLCACARPSTEQNQYFITARWIQPNSVLAYSTYSFVAHYSGEYGSDGGTYDHSSIRIFTVHVDSLGFSGKHLIYEADSTVPCDDMQYRLGDSLLFFSYTPLSSEYPYPITKWSDCSKGLYYQAFLTAGKVTPASFNQIQGLDTVTLLTQLRTDTVSPDVDVVRYDAKICVGSHCMSITEAQ